MNAEQFLALAESLRSYAQNSGRDLNATNLFVHNMLMRAIRSGEHAAVALSDYDEAEAVKAA